MHKINTITKKFSEAVTIDLGQLPTVDARIDFILTDGTNPVIAENKTFTLTIGTVEGTLYKTDADTVSFRYLKFNSGNVSSTLPITIKMEGIEILNDTVSLTYQTSGGGGSVQVDTGLNESSPNPVANSTLTPIINGKADKATTIAGYGITDAYTKPEVDAKVSSVYRYKGTVSTYADLPSSGQEVGDVWNIETADSAHGIKAGDNVAWTGSEWDVLSGTVDLTPYATKTELATVATTGSYNDLTNKPDLTTKLDAPAVAGTVGQVLTKTADGVEWADAPGGGGGGTDGNPDYLSFYFNDDNKTITFSKNGNPTDVSLEYSFDKKTWTPVIVDSSISVPKQTECYFRGNNNTFSTSESDFYYFKTNSFPYIYGNIMSLLDKSCASKTVPNYCFSNLFNKTYTTYNIQSFKATLPATVLGIGCYYRMFYNQSSDSAFNTVVLPALYLNLDCYEQMFYGCYSLRVVSLYGNIPSSISMRETFKNCANLSRLICHNSNPNSYYNPNWLENAGTSVSSPRLYCLNAEKISSRNGSTVPANWEVYSLNGTQGISNEVASSSETYTINYGKTLDTPVITVASALTLSATTPVASTQIAYAEVVLDVATGATVTAGTNMTLVDTPTAGKRNICVCRWSGGVCKLYVTIVEDLPQA